MATMLAYTSPALGYLLPVSALLSELSGRGHSIHLRTMSAGVLTGRRLRGWRILLARRLRGR